MNNQETSAQLGITLETGSIAPTSVDTTRDQTALSVVLCRLEVESFFAVGAQDHLRAELNRPVWEALVSKAKELGLTIDQPEKEDQQISNPTNTVVFADGTAVALRINGEKLIVFVKHPNRSDFYPLAKSYTR